MRTINSFILLCVFCLFCQPILAQRRVRLADLPPFERAVVVVKYFEGLHNKPKDFPYVGYGHQLQPGEHFTADMTARSRQTPCSVPTFGNVLNTSRGMVRMPCYSAYLPIMWVWDDYLVMASIQRVGCYKK